MPSEPCPCPLDGAVVPTIGVVTTVNVEECWVVGLHWAPNAGRRSALGNLMHRAKTYRAGPPGDRAAADELGKCLAWWACHLRDTMPRSRIRDASVVFGVPDNPPKRPFNLPDVLAEHVGTALGVPFERVVEKVRPTEEIKFETDHKAKTTALSGAFRATRSLEEQTVVVVDDLVLSGATLESIAEELRAAGAARVIALVATRATKGLSA